MNTQADFVEGALGATETTETTLGTISIPTAGIKHIVGVYGICEAITTTAESLCGYFKLTFKTVSGVYKFPCQVFASALGTVAANHVELSPKIIPVDITIPANESVSGIMALNSVATGACRGMVGIIME